MWSGPEVALDTYILDSVLAASRSGALFLAYSIPGDGTGTREVFGRMRIGGEWQPAEHIGTTFSGGQIEAAVDLDGRPWLTFVQDSEGPVEMQVLAHRDETGWSTEDLFPGAPGYLSGASLVFDRHGSMWLAARNDHAVELRTRCATLP